MTLPLIRLTDSELMSGTLDPTTRLLARQIFASKGVLAIENAFPPKFIGSLKDKLMSDYARDLVHQESDETLNVGDKRSGETLKVGDKRIMVSVEISGVFNTPQLYANPFVFPLMQDSLGEECILGSFVAIAALPGAGDQHIHRDHPLLFNEERIDTLMPAYAINVIVPLVEINQRYGTTRIWPGSHRVWRQDEAEQLPSEDLVSQVGSCILLDFRLLHRGMGNYSQQVRPILCLDYHRSWFKDCVSFQKLKELRVPDWEHKNIPEALQRLFPS